MKQYFHYSESGGFKTPVIKLSFDPEFVIIDLFCGAGGTTTGFENAFRNGVRVAKVVACVNHDPIAIKSHWENHPEVVHYEEDIRSLDLGPLSALVEAYRVLYPKAKIVLWASLECTNFSKAKGGQPRDPDSRTLADDLDRYVVALNPDYIQIENVVEFMSWGPLDDNGKPVSKNKGEDWLRWRKEICALGYKDDWKELNSADFGAYTSRNRLFGCFAKVDLQIVWPKPTHAKNVNIAGLFGELLLKWKPVRDVLDLEDEGKSIFDRKKPLSDKTINVIIDGLIKSIKENEDTFLFKYYGNGSNLQSINTPAGTLTTKDRFAIIFRQYKTGFTSSINKPIGALPTNPKANILHFILNPSHGGHTTSINRSCPVIIARQDKAPLYVLKCIMDEYGIVDIKMRMLKVGELKVIQGFPSDYVLCGNQTDQKKFIGNSVVPHVVKSWCEAMSQN